ncbi:hypothetical protein [Sulfolobus acidocaldarius]|uniref:Conserved protein n=4 Tax=Sulfolobus acidocaldarius TaxID=2285 RepID=Q4JAB8_SULAC|nr:hypothetical protein [Sulfolobus acidocaldarius]AHC51240.1 hypothetical protein SUSAZ_04105 [Sulfolobus acidocaldarius SUSAZ]AAY80262.1 conserved protein [Sulfolobus acidocaldarius DSM 639]AGE70842.1 hypothetical protein SacN8_04355 [Sulfolobus acidocaldarius N8]AGE73113.1 hypothetical protein SacRon12I_04345 [Sulfolobus acidocaldarius Ron12/I]ALU28845.1 hypothetical protein ATY89_01935 [Sulfolobus acidocaldarius]
MEPIRVKLSTGREVIVDENAIRVLNEYVRTQMTLEQLARRLGLTSWEEAYELVKQIPSYVMWTPVSIYSKQVQ